jgi:hypothetical protein
MSTTCPTFGSGNLKSTGQLIVITWSILQGGLLWKRLLRSHLLSLCIPIPLLPWNNCHRVLRTPRSSQVYLYMYRDCGPSRPTQTNYVLPFTCADVIGVVTMLSNVLSMWIRTRQKESLKRTVTICNARSVAHKCTHKLFNGFLRTMYMAAYVTNHGWQWYFTACCALGWAGNCIPSWTGS